MGDTFVRDIQSVAPKVPRGVNYHRTWKCDLRKKEYFDRQIQMLERGEGEDRHSYLAIPPQSIKGSLCGEAPPIADQPSVDKAVPDQKLHSIPRNLLATETNLWHRGC